MNIDTHEADYLHADYLSSMHTDRIRTSTLPL